MTADTCQIKYYVFEDKKKNLQVIIPEGLGK